MVTVLLLGRFAIFWLTGRPCCFLPTTVFENRFDETVPFSDAVLAKNTECVVGSNVGGSCMNFTDQKGRQVMVGKNHGVFDV